MSRISFVTPTYRPVGGVIKVFDYAVHALDLGHEVIVSAPEPVGGPLFSIPRFSDLEERGVAFADRLRFGVQPEDLVLFSWPEHHDHVLQRLDEETPLCRVIHLVQNVRHANPTWLDGYAARLLARPMSRVMVSRQVMNACADLVDRSCPVEVIEEGHDWPFFHRMRSGGWSSPIKVGYTTWKSAVGAEVESQLSGSREFVFRSIGGTVGWDELAELYEWCDVFLGTPGPEEGFYLAGLEAMAAGALVVIPDAGGNRAYCRFGENCVEVPFGSASAYVAALHHLRDAAVDRIEAMRTAGYAVLDHHRLERERDEFGRFLQRIDGVP